ncbi:hypothetical protein ACEWY4_008100 [Coilia grayii]|uniref:G-protein coupled receptors family 1 profile domain-containing protein n=1 Tax=Coilia grayii TaxID=363190 RepID=A0ABD1K9Y1_9TELE
MVPLSTANTPVTASSANLLDCMIDLDAINFVVGWLYIVLFVPALLLNIMAAWISWNLKTKSACIMYLKNLLAADLLMTLLIPLRGADRLPGSSLALRAFNCKFGSVLFYLCMEVSIVLLGVISLDRFFKIVQPGGKLLGQSALFRKVVSAVVWVLLLSSCTIPTMVLTDVKPPNNTSILCMDMKSDLGKEYHTVVTMFGNQLENETDCPWAKLSVAKDMTLWISTTNVCLDPLIYIVLCKAFREKLYELKILGSWFSTTAQQGTESSP